MPIPLFDAHCDTINAVIKNGGVLLENPYHLDLKRAGVFSPYAQIFAVWDRPHGVSTYGMDYTGPDFPEAELTALGEAGLSRLLSELEKNREACILCRSHSDAFEAARLGKTAAFISIEGAELVGCSMDRMWDAFERGVRIVNITWNYDNKLSGAAMGSRGGLTDDGRAFVRFLGAIGVAVDVSHMSERAFWDLCELETGPFLASHSSSRTLCDHPRNLTDAQFCAVRDAGGAAGVNLCPDFLGLGRDIEAAVLHIEHFLSLGGERTVCLGGDLDGIDDLPTGFCDVRDYSLIYDALLKRNYPEKLVRDIFYCNLLDTLGRILP